ncbi:Threonine/homoserine/homoserine lactone efflux protein [Rathayibacter oskolensis]|uniref:Threonine/homoserine/homoserine lactone efflux protein n=1 Tax=Rathayibacter oskolensis TaxID=1891671 RepID=A0A1X7MYC9_9MICO|nr:LysE family translocator [Rathayibacter oskolensis]SMH29453.1 Threonine/homoserine/homoserine lactone efflux protein [Rathayibacter oskolensis]
MPPAAGLWAFALASFALIVIPGPSVLFVVGRSLALGRKGGFVSVLGNALGMLPAIALVALGVGSVVAESVAVFTAIKLVGAAYLVYLGVQAIRHRHDDGSASAAPKASPSLVRLLREGFIVGVTNPKTIVFFVAVLPQFVAYDRGGIPLQMVALGLVFFTIALASDSAWALTAGTARTWFARNPRRLSRMSAGGGVMMIGLGGTLALTGTRA